MITRRLSIAICVGTLAACASSSPTVSPATPTTSSESLSTGLADKFPDSSPDPSLGIVAPLGTQTVGAAIGRVSVGPESCVSLWTTPDSPYRPNLAARVFVLWLPEGWTYRGPNPDQNQVGDPIQIVDNEGRVAADYGDTIAVFGEIAGEGGGGFCGYGQSFVAQELTHEPSVSACSDAVDQLQFWQAVLLEDLGEMESVTPFQVRFAKARLPGYAAAAATFIRGRASCYGAGVVASWEATLSGLGNPDAASFSVKAASESLQTLPLTPSSVGIAPPTG